MLATRRRRKQQLTPEDVNAAVARGVEDALRTTPPESPPTRRLYDVEVELRAEEERERIAADLAAQEEAELEAMREEQAAVARRLKEWRDRLPEALERAGLAEPPEQVAERFKQNGERVRERLAKQRPEAASAASNRPGTSPAEGDGSAALGAAGHEWEGTEL